MGVSGKVVTHRPHRRPSTVKLKVTTQQLRETSSELRPSDIAKVFHIYLIVNQLTKS